MSADLAFVDTNVWVYRFDTADSEKQAIAADKLEELHGSIIISTQVLSEFFVTVTRRLREPLEPQEAQHAVSVMARLPVRTIQAADVLAATELAQTARLSYWDGLIVSTARSAGCATLITEDLSHGQTVGGVRVRSPFAGRSN